MRSASRSGNDRFQTALTCGFRIFHHPLRGAVSRNNSHFERHVKLSEHVGGGLHDSKIRITAHNDPDLGSLKFCRVVSQLAALL